MMYSGRHLAYSLFLLSRYPFYQCPVSYCDTLSVLLVSCALLQRMSEASPCLHVCMHGCRCRDAHTYVPNSGLYFANKTEKAAAAVSCLELPKVDKVYFSDCSQCAACPAQIRPLTLYMVYAKNCVPCINGICKELLRCRVCQNM